MPMLEETQLLCAAAALADHSFSLYVGLSCVAIPGEGDAGTAAEVRQYFFNGFTAFSLSRHMAISTHGPMASTISKVAWPCEKLTNFNNQEVMHLPCFLASLHTFLLQPVLNQFHGGVPRNC